MGLSNLVRSKYPFLFERLSFQLVEPYEPEKQKVILKSSDMALWIMQEHNYILVAVGPITGPVKWFEVVVLIGMLTTRDGLTASLDDQMEFINTHYLEIAACLRPERLDATNALWLEKKTAITKKW